MRLKEKFQSYLFKGKEKFQEVPEIFSQVHLNRKSFKRIGLVLLAGFSLYTNSASAAETDSVDCTKQAEFKDGIWAANARLSGVDFPENYVTSLTRENIQNAVFDWGNTAEIEVNKNGLKVPGVSVLLDGKEAFVSQKVLEKVEGCDFQVAEKKAETVPKKETIQDPKVSDAFDYFKNRTEKNKKITLQIAKLESFEKSALERKLERITEFFLSKSLVESEKILKSVLPKIGKTYSGSVVDGVDEIFTSARKSLENGAVFKFREILNQKEAELELQKPKEIQEQEKVEKIEKTFSKEILFALKEVAKKEFVKIYQEIPSPSDRTQIQIGQVEKQLNREVGDFTKALKTKKGLNNFFEKFESKNPWFVFRQIGIKYFEKVSKKLDGDKTWMKSVLNTKKQAQILELNSYLSSFENFQKASSDTLLEVEKVKKELEKNLSEKVARLYELYQSEAFLIEISLKGNKSAVKRIEEIFSEERKELEKKYKRSLEFLLKVDKDYEEMKKKKDFEASVSTYQIERLKESSFYQQVGDVLSSLKFLDKAEKQALEEKLNQIVTDFLSSGNFSQFIREFNQENGTQISDTLKKRKPHDTWFTKKLFNLLEKVAEKEQLKLFKNYIVEQENKYRFNYSQTEAEEALKKNPKLQLAGERVEKTVDRAGEFNFVTKENVKVLEAQLNDFYYTGVISPDPEKYFYAKRKVFDLESKIPEEFFQESRLSGDNSLYWAFDDLATAARIASMRPIFQALSAKEVAKAYKSYGYEKIFSVLAITDSTSDVELNLNEEYDDVIYNVYKSHSEKEKLDDFFDGDYEKIKWFIYRHLGIESGGKEWVRAWTPDRRGAYAVGCAQGKNSFNKMFGGNPHSKEGCVANLFGHLIYDFYGDKNGGKYFADYEESFLRYDLALQSHISWGGNVVKALEKSEKKTGTPVNFSDYMATEEQRKFLKRADRTLAYLKKAGKLDLKVGENSSDTFLASASSSVRARVSEIQAFNSN